MIDIEDYWELLALHKAIMEAKFGEGENREVLTSPFLATVARKVLLSVVEAEKKKNGDARAAGWESWKMVDENRNEWNKLITVIDESERLQTLGDDEIACEIRNILSPLEITDLQISKLIEARIRKE